MNKSATAIWIPEGIRVVGKYAFRDCYNLRSISLPEGVKEIREEAFYGCRNLQEIILPQGLTPIGNGAFRDCRDLTVTVSGDSVGEQYCRENNVKYRF